MFYEIIEKHWKTVKDVPIFLAAIFIVAFLSGIRVSDRLHDERIKAFEQQIKDMEQQKTFCKESLQSKEESLDLCLTLHQSTKPPSALNELKLRVMSLSSEISDFINNNPQVQGQDYSSNPQVKGLNEKYMKEYREKFMHNVITLHQDILFREIKIRNMYYYPNRPTNILSIKNDLDRLGNCLQ